MRLFLLTAFLLIAAASSSTIRSRSRNASKPYLVTAPKIFLGEESVCLTIFQEDIPNNAQLRVQLKSADGETLQLIEQQLKSGTSDADLTVQSLIESLLIFAVASLSVCASTCARRAR